MYGGLVYDAGKLAKSSCFGGISAILWHAHIKTTKNKGTYEERIDELRIENYIAKQSRFSDKQQQLLKNNYDVKYVFTFLTDRSNKRA